MTNAATNLYVLLNNQMGGFTEVPQSFGHSTSQAILADLNGDGNLDLVLNYDVYLGNGAGQFTFAEMLVDDEVNEFPPPAMVADVDGDGIPDICLLAGDVATFLGLGNGTYAPPIYFGAGPSPGSLFPANLRGQKPSVGLPDLVVPDTSGGVEVLINQTK